MLKRILLVLISVYDMNGYLIGLWFEEFVVFYYVLKKVKFDVDIVLIKGGRVFIDRVFILNGIFCEFKYVVFLL